MVTATCNSLWAPGKILCWHLATHSYFSRLAVCCMFPWDSVGLVNVLRDEANGISPIKPFRSWAACILVAALLCMATMLSSEHCFERT
ncbi:hypothetical protein R3P38DRAFT_2932268 [Favolaschia claudopus]|uniref:Uncharacterized protein n=1 Tax=Favolaschia claudopus TaxID=2862362 RepID=A0AAW0BUT2_9AGAR